MLRCEYLIVTTVTTVAKQVLQIMSVFEIFLQVLYTILQTLTLDSPNWEFKYCKLLLYLL